MAGGKARAAQRDATTAVRVADLRAAIEARAKDDNPPAAPVNFEAATFRAVVRRATINARGEWQFLAEVPYADRNAFFPVTGAAEIELVFEVRRRQTNRRSAAG